MQNPNKAVFGCRFKMVSDRMKMSFSKFPDLQLKTFTQPLKIPYVKKIKLKLS